MSASEASFAALCGVSPVEYSSGRRHHRQLMAKPRREASRRGVCPAPSGGLVQPSPCARACQPGSSDLSGPRRQASGTASAPRRECCRSVRWASPRSP
ncbi:transposase [Streptomyces platensis]|uniref:transposase n=1 Tax=Streptomyces platensis TaxID=58346 RepID=UPI002E26FA8E|nr:transposase [Streptomyces platensis]